MKNKANIAVLVSGGGTNLQALIDAEKNGIIHSGHIALVISNKSDAYALERAKIAKIPSEVISKKDFASAEKFEDELIRVLEAYETDLIVLAGFMVILSEKFTKHFANRVINVHPSLIPSFCGEGYFGLRVHEAALAKGVKVTGATVHFVNEIPDGGEIIMQKAVDVLPNDTPESLQLRVMREAEWQILPAATEEIARKIIFRSIKMNQYHINDITELLSGNPYPGRGIIIGKTPDGSKACAAYFIMGRSNNSRNRIFTEKDGAVYTEPFDISKMENPDLIIYAALRQYENQLIVTNGDQTDTIYEFLEKGKCFNKALSTRAFEPDAPNYTPRISGLLTFEDNDFTYKINILKSIDEAGSECARYTFSYPGTAGLGHFIHTYISDGNPLPTFTGEPERVAMADDIDTFADQLWNALNEDNKISLYVRYVDLESGATENRLYNKNQK